MRKIVNFIGNILLTVAIAVAAIFCVVGAVMATVFFLKILGISINYLFLTG